MTTTRLPVSSSLTAFLPSGSSNRSTGQLQNSTTCFLFITDGPRTFFLATSHSLLVTDLSQVPDFTLFLSFSPQLAPADYCLTACWLLQALPPFHPKQPSRKARNYRTYQVLSFSISKFVSGFSAGAAALLEIKHRKSKIGNSDFSRVYRRLSEKIGFHNLTLFPFLFCFCRANEGELPLCSKEPLLQCQMKN